MSQPIVHILLATYNGEEFLHQQWASLEAQQGVELVVHVADDGSSDGTVPLARELAARASGAIRDVRWLESPPRGSAARSFLALMREAVGLGEPGEWFAYADQDDIWLPGKLSAAVRVLTAHGGGELPALYGGRSITMDAFGRDRGLSPLFMRAPSFCNALVQNIMGGNTMVMNRSAAQLVAAAADSDVNWHDWLTYQLVSAVGGFIYYDARPFLRYRQHGNNVMGSNRRLLARWRRLMSMFRGDFGEWNRRNLQALMAQTKAFTAGARASLAAFHLARTAPTPWSRLVWLHRSGAFRQKPSEQLMLWLACALRRL